MSAKRTCAVLAADLVTALGAGREQVWSAMLAGACGLRPMRRFPRDKYQTAVAGEIPAETEAALAAELGAGASSRAWLLALAVGRRALRQHDVGRLARTGLVLATTKADLEELERRASDPAVPGPGRFLPHVLARDLAAELGLGGPTLAVSNACASGLVAVVQAVRLLERGAAEAMLVIGVDVLADFLLAGFSSLAALSPRPCRPFDQARDGLSRGEGAGALLLAIQPGDGGPRLAAVRGWGVANDANHITGPSRTAEGLKLALAQALKRAGLGPRDVGCVNSHGTGTPYNDEMEAQALAAVFGENQPPAFSMKGYFGHTLGAAGVIEAGLCLTVLHERTVPTSLGFERLGVTKPINVPARTLRLKALDNVVTVKCGFGGINAAVVLGA
jgi:3-oxoacyl-(acyl-carrier-protein) synthase